MKVYAKALVSMVALALVISISQTALAGYGTVVTPIDNVLSYKNGLELSDKQVAKLEKFNQELIQEITEVQTQLDIRKVEIENLTADWSKVHGTATDHLIGEYYDLQAKLKQLELEAIMKARGVLSIQQMRMFVELASIEAMMLDELPDQASAY